MISDQVWSEYSRLFLPEDINEILIRELLPDMELSDDDVRSALALVSDLSRQDADKHSSDDDLMKWVAFAKINPAVTTLILLAIDAKNDDYISRFIKASGLPEETESVDLMRFIVNLTEQAASLPEISSSDAAKLLPLRLRLHMMERQTGRDGGVR